MALAMILWVCLWNRQMERPRTAFEVTARREVVPFSEATGSARLLAPTQDAAVVTHRYLRPPDGSSLLRRTSEGCAVFFGKNSSLLLRLKKNRLAPPHRVGRFLITSCNYKERFSSYLKPQATLIVNPILRA